jgi:ABC-2 type transport system permease protein
VVLVFDLAWKDLLEIGRDWKSALFLLIMPILFTLFFGIVLGPEFQADEDQGGLPVGIINADTSGDLGVRLESLLTQSGMVQPEILAPEQEALASKLVADEEQAAIIVIPAGFTGRWLADELPTVTVIADRSTQSGQTAGNAIETAMARLASVAEIAEISADEFAGRQAFDSPAARQDYLSEASRLATEAWSRPPIVVERVLGGAQSPDEPALESGFVQSSPGMMVQFAIFGLITAAMVLVLERKAGALQRMLTTPISRAEIIGGHTLAMFGIIFVQQIVLVTVGQLLFGVGYARAPGAILLMVFSLSLWAASLGLLIGAVSKTEDQVVTVSLIAMFVFSGLGGAWFPLEVAGKAFATIGHVMPTAWAMDGLQNVVVRGLGLESVLVPAGLMLAYTAAFFGLAVWRFKFE